MLKNLVKTKQKLMKTKTNNLYFRVCIANARVWYVIYHRMLNLLRIFFANWHYLFLRLHFDASKKLKKEKTLCLVGLGSPNANNSNNAWKLNFNNGNDNNNNRNNSNYVRLVRGSNT